MQQGSDIAPRAVSTRVAAGCWWFFTLVGAIYRETWNLRHAYFVESAYASKVIDEA